uniref:Fucolectin uncharacterized LOC100491211 n=1 Tax=Xenopus tropicalis TaxID=8364 RepID=A0A803J4A7_XENTR
MMFIRILLTSLMIGWAQTLSWPKKRMVPYILDRMESSDDGTEIPIDDYKERNIYARPCAGRSNGNSTWCHLDLKKKLKVESVIMENRGDCCWECLIGTQVHVGDSADINNPLCGNITDISQTSVTLPCEGMKGRYVSVSVPQRSEYQQLCEINVSGEEIRDQDEMNLARKGKVRQSSAYTPLSLAKEAVDGNKETNHHTKPCSHTDMDNPAWWQLDLKKGHKVENVVVVNRRDCCPERLLGAEIRIGNSPDNNNPVCGTITNVSQTTINLFCEGMEGRYVSVVIPGRAEYLTLCEVEVYGQELDQEEAMNLARSGEAQQSSISMHGPMQTADRAIDGIDETDNSRSPCSHTNNNYQPWWRLDLKRRYKVETVVIVNSMDRFSERLLGAEIRVGDSANNNNPVCASVTDTNQAITIYSCKGMEGRYVSVVIPGRSEYLSLCEVEVYVKESTNQQVSEMNLARKGEAKQSSLYINGPQFTPERAIDGSKETNVSKYPCAHTNNDTAPWWQLQLEKRYKIETVVIVNRMDEHRERLLGAEILVGDSADNDNPICGTITDVSQATITLSCNGMEGRYVSVVIPGRAEYLTLCEVEVYGEESPNQEVLGVNLARSGEAKQSSDYNHALVLTAGRAIDGVKLTDLHQGPCTHTNNEYQPWWQLDLKKRYKVKSVIVVNRGDCCSERLKGAEIRVGDSPTNNNPVCGTINDVSQATNILFCNGMEGRYLSVVIPGRKGPLTLCEVEVYGEESPNQEVVEMNLARSGEARQSSTYGHGTQFYAERAIDGIKVTDIHKSPCTHTSQDNPAWWRLDLKKRYKVESVVIVNRMDEHSERLRGAEIRVGNVPQNNNPVCGIINDISEDTITLHCNGMEGRYVSVVIPRRAEFLTLCEVEVYGEESPRQEVVDINLARSGKAQQSSVNGYQHGAEKAIDGIKGTNMGKNPCTHTQEDYQPWWRLDLQKRYKVETVVIVNRMDGSSSRLMGAEIRIGDSVDNNNPVCGTVTDVSEATITLFCEGLEGRYVSVVIPGRVQYLTLCEVEVYGEESLSQEVVELNLARSGEVRQSSTYGHGTQFIADRAIDGIKVTDIDKGPCTHTSQDNPAWWRLDLKKRYNVKSVVIVNRRDEHSERLLGAEIRVGKDPHNSNPVCGIINDISEDTITLHCNGMEGRYVSVVIPGRAEFLTLCEVEVYGEDSPRQEDKNLARSGKAQQSSFYGHTYTAETVIDGIKGTNIMRNPCSHTQEDYQPWWRLDLQKRYKVETVVIVNRRDCCSSRLLAAEIRIGDSVDNNNPVCGTVTDVSQLTITLCCNGMEGRYVSVVIPGREEFLSLCEVEVYGEEATTQRASVSNIAMAHLFIHPCAHTNNYNLTWWRLDLKKRYKVQKVVIVHRLDEHKEHLLGSEIRVGDSVDINNPVCGTITEVSTGSITVPCEGMAGYYVTVLIRHSAEYLQLSEVEVYGEESADYKGVNLARQGEVVQSSTFLSSHVAETAIDGIKLTYLSIYPCAHTSDDKPPWWRLDLKSRFAVEYVFLVYRMDDTRERLLGAEIRIGDSADNKNPVCATITDVSIGTVTLRCNGMEGRYVSVVIPGRREYLTLCEVEVYGEKIPDPTGVNLARLGEAWQSSTFDSYPAEAATDGIKVTDLFTHPCTHTNSDSPAWWRLDLKKRYKVQTVIIVNRGDCCWERLLGAEIRIGNYADDNNPVCGTVTEGTKAIITLCCEGMEGRYVSVVIPRRAAVLQLCEVEVYGEESTGYKDNLAQSGEVSQSSTYRPECGAAAAVDGVKGTNPHTPPCTHTQCDPPAWWRLDLKKRYNVQTVIVTRMEQSERLRGAEIRVGDFENNNNPVCGTITDVSQTNITLSCNGTEGRYVSVVIPGREEYLQLCEVEVYGEESINQEGINLARSGEVRQSSTRGRQYGAERAIDGNKDTNSCTQTNEESPAWWRLDLMGTYRIGAVLIVGAGERLLGAEIQVGDLLTNNPPCATITEVFQDATTVYCYGMEGRYVTVLIPGRSQSLSLCEVEVYGHRPYTGQ